MNAIRVAEWDIRFAVCVVGLAIATGGRADPPKASAPDEALLAGLLQQGRVDEAYGLFDDPKVAARTLDPMAQRPDQKRRLAALHRAKAPDDPFATRMHARVLREDGRFAEAAKLRAKMPDGPDRDATIGVHVELLLVDPDPLARIAEASSPATTANSFVHFAINEGEVRLARRVFDKYLIGTDNAEVTELLLFARETPEKAPALLDAILAKMPAADRDKYLSQRSLFLVDAGLALPVYERISDPVKAFEVVADFVFVESMCRSDHLGPLLEAHRKRTGGKAPVGLVEVVALQHLGRWKEAYALATQWEPKQTGFARGEMRGLRIDSLVRDDQWRKAYEEVRPRSDTFARLARHFERYGQHAELAELLELHEPHASGDALFLSVLANAEVRDHQPGRGPELMKEALKRDPWHRDNPERIRRFVHEMVAIGQHVEAYRAIPARFGDVAIEAIFHASAEHHAPRILEETLRLHFNRGLPDPRTPLWQAYVHAWRGDLAKAEASHLEVARPEPLGIRDDLPKLGPNDLPRVQVRLGKTATGYLLAGPRDPLTFRIYAQACIDAAAPGELRSLIAAHRRADPYDPYLALFELEAMALERNPKGVLQAIEADKPRYWHGPVIATRVRDLWLRTMAKTGRFAEAMAVADAMEKRLTGSRQTLMVVYASTGDAARTLARLEGLPYARRIADRLHADRDFLALTNWETLQAFRMRYPPPRWPAGTYDAE